MSSSLGSDQAVSRVAPNEVQRRVPSVTAQGDVPTDGRGEIAPFELGPALQCVARNGQEPARIGDIFIPNDALLADILHISSAGVFSWRVAHKAISASNELFRLFELDPTQPMTLRQIFRKVPLDDRPRLRDIVERARSGHDTIESAFRLRMRDRSVKHVQMIARRCRGGSGDATYRGVIRDVTLRRVSEDALSKARSEIAHLSRLATLGTLTASIVHEVAQPIAAVVTNANTLRSMLADDPPNIVGAREVVNRTIRDGQRASDVITRLRDLFSKKSVATESIYLNEIAGEVIAFSRNELQRARVVLRAELADRLPPIKGDRVQLQQVILNLLLNACEAMSAVDARARELVIRTTSVESDQVRLSVQDSGRGFEPQDIQEIFEPFRTNKISGMGIGLSVSRSIIDNHGGSIWAAENDGPGATFSFQLPANLDPRSGCAAAPVCAHEQGEREPLMSAEK